MEPLQAKLQDYSRVKLIDEHVHMPCLMAIERDGPTTKGVTYRVLLVHIQIRTVHPRLSEPQSSGPFAY